MKLNFNWQKLLEQTIEALYLLAIFAVPLIFSWLIPTANVFELNKTIYFRVIVLLLLFLSLGRYFFYGGALINPRRRYFLAPAIFIAFMALTILWSPDRVTSFFGLYDRQEGVLSYLFFFLWFLIMVYNLGYGNRARKILFIFRTITISATLVALYAWLQIMALDPIVWSEPAFLTSRATSTLGQPNFLASFLLLTWPLAVYLFKRASRFGRGAWLFCLVVQLGAIYFTLSRGAWLGLALALVVALGWGIKKIREQKRISRRQLKILIISGLVIIVVASVWAFSSSGKLGQRLRSSFNLEQGSVGPRLTFWKSSFWSIYQKPLLGYGVENQELELIKYYEKDWGINGFVNARTNRAHNFILDFALAGGVVLALLFIWVLIELYDLLVVRIKADGRAAYLLLSLLGYFVSLFFSFSFVSGQVYFWLYLALAVALSYEGFLGKKTTRFHALDISWRLSLWILLIPFIFLGIKMQLSALTADHYFYLLRSNFNAGKYAEAAGYYSQIEALPVLQRNYYRDRYIALWYDVSLGGVADGASGLLVGQMKQTAEGIKAGDYYSMLSKAKAMALAGEYPAAEKLFLKVINYTPSLPENYLFLARLYLYEGKINDAVNYLEEAHRLVPDSGDPRLNETHRLDISRYLSSIEYYSGEASIKQGKYAAARNYYQASLKHFYDLRLYKKIADTYYLEKNIDRAIWFNQRAMYLDRGNYIWPLALSYLYQEKGDLKLFAQYQALAKSLKK